jgi:hypothetical protein
MVLRGAGINMECDRNERKRTAKGRGRMGMEGFRRKRNLAFHANRWQEPAYTAFDLRLWSTLRWPRVGGCRCRVGGCSWPCLRLLALTGCPQVLFLQVIVVVASGGQLVDDERLLRL